MKEDRIVLSCLTGEWQTVSQIVNKLEGLYTSGQVRGVLTRYSNQGLTIKMRASGGAVHRLKSE